MVGATAQLTTNMVSMDQSYELKHGASGNDDVREDQEISVGEPAHLSSERSPSLRFAHLSGQKLSLPFWLAGDFW